MEKLSHYELLCMAEGITRDAIADLKGVYVRSLGHYVSPTEFKSIVDEAILSLTTLSSRLGEAES